MLLCMSVCALFVLDFNYGDVYIKLPKWKLRGNS